MRPLPFPRWLLGQILGWSAGVLEDAVAELDRVSLVGLDEAGDPFAHRLLMGFVKHRGIGDAVFKAVVEAVEQETRRTQDEQDTASYNELEAIMPHAETMLASGRIGDDVFVRIATNLRHHSQCVGQYVLARHSERML